MSKILLKDWTLSCDKFEIPCEVPGDITIDCFKAGKIANPYFGLNHFDSAWIQDIDWTYKAKLELSRENLQEDKIEIVFEGIDTYSTIAVNGHEVGQTNDMFLKYVFDIKELVHEGENTLEVKMKSTRKVMEGIDASRYYSIFNDKRLFVRKAQCHFGWDWAPDIAAYGIWQECYVEAHTKFGFEDVQVLTDIKGNVIFRVELNYTFKSLRNCDGVVINVSPIAQEDDKLRIYGSKTPFGEPELLGEIEVTGIKNFGAFKYEKPELWWPYDLGDSPLYNYRIELLRSNKVVNVKEGRFAFREVKLLQEPKAPNILGYALEINGVETFIKGSNWVPTECFTGTLKDEKYASLIELAKQGNINMLRIWGGGYYEKDIFYDICDEQGILVWQDMMFACADIPEDNAEFVELCRKEITYQIKRLRNHPSIVYWCGGNEKTGTYGFCITMGDFFAECFLRGIIDNLDGTRPYATQSPCAWTDVGNDATSGETHYNSLEAAFVNGMHVYRRMIASKKVPFISECATMGPNSVETNKKIYPEDKLWPTNEVWEDRNMYNPYGADTTSFTKRQLKYISELYGEPKSVEEFVSKGMLVHAETIKAECEFARSNKGITSGYLNWMYSDIWPSGTWAIVDYFLEPKEAYYQAKRSYQPVLISFTVDKDENLVLFAVNDLNRPVKLVAHYGVKKLDGTIVKEATHDFGELTNEAKQIIIDMPAQKDEYHFVNYEVDKEEQTTLFSLTFWGGIKFESDIETEIEMLNEHNALIKIHANKFAKSVFIKYPDNFKVLYTDNYIDIEAGDTKCVIASSNEVIDPAKFIIEDFGKINK